MKLKMLRPVPVGFEISSPFGMRVHPISGISKFHRGVDFAVPAGTPVVAMMTGRVFKVGYEDPSNQIIGLGLRIWQECLLDTETYYVWYAHLSQAQAHEGNVVVAGEQIAVSGNSGASSGPHLHVQARKKDTGEYFDMEFLPPEDYYG